MNVIKIHTITYANKEYPKAQPNRTPTLYAVYGPPENDTFCPFSETALYRPKPRGLEGGIGRGYPISCMAVVV